MFLGASSPQSYHGLNVLAESSSIAPSTILRSPQFVHLRYTLLELVVLALLVCVSLILHRLVRLISLCLCATTGIPRISMVGSMCRPDIGSMVSEDVRMCLGRE